MANYRAVASRFPAVRDYLRNRRWTRRGDVIAYAPNMRARCFSTDPFGFRHTSWRGADHGIATCNSGERFGLVLGSSHVFGFGLESNRETLPSRLSERLGFPCLNISYPEADTRTLYATLLRIATHSAVRPSLVVYFNGGDLTRYCYHGVADPLFGSPNFDSALTNDMPAISEDQAFQNLTFYIGFWTRQLVELTARLRIPFCFATDSTFFEKEDLGAADATEVACELGASRDERHARRFAIHRRRVYEYGDFRVALAQQLGIAPPFYEPGIESFIDEFHFRAESLALMADRIATRLKPGA